MIPEFNDDGNLPIGVHLATLDEIADRFGAETELRQVQMQSLRWLVDLAWRAGGLRVIVNGSFVTDAIEPNDVDCVVLIADDYPKSVEADCELQEGLPFIQVELVKQPVFDYFVETYFATSRSDVEKGVIEVRP